MELLFNELSIHEQFENVKTFHKAFSRVMAIHEVARRYKRELLCNTAVLNLKPVPNIFMQQAIMELNDQNQIRAAMNWLTKTGPFWDDMRTHARDDWLELGSNAIVTDTAVGEAAFRAMHGMDCGLVSFSPSDWNFTPVEVIWRRKAEELEDRTTNLDNWWDIAALENALRNSTQPIQSWEDLRGAATTGFENLVFAEDCFAPLTGVPFAKSAAQRFLVLFDILNKLSLASDGTGERTAEGHKIYRDYFIGDGALFSDSSNREKQKFRQALTFPHPVDSKDSLFCTWHGKVRRQTLRMHFSWPVNAGMPVYVVYAGPKITKS